MGLVPIMWSLWALSVVLLLGVSIYAARLGRNEEDQLFLADSSGYARSEQEAIAARVDRIQPLKRTAIFLTGVMTLLVMAYYVVDMFRQF